MRILSDLRRGLLIGGSLSKVYITIPVTITTSIGFVVYSGFLSPDLLPLLTGVFLLAAGSSALNHYQERATDALMERTRKRPIPARQVSPEKVVVLTLVMLASGSIILLLNFPIAVLLLGLFNFFWYNAIYTPLKKVTAFAVVPGSVTGGVPPVIGWVAAGGYILDPSIMVIVLFFVTGQIPHFWLLLLKYGGEYEKAGLPSVTLLFTDRQIRRISYAWIFAATAASLLLTVYGLISHPASLAALLAGITVLCGLMVRQELFPGSEGKSNLIFLSLNGFYLLIMILLAMEALFHV